MPNVLFMSHQFSSGGPTTLSTDSFTRADSATSPGSDDQSHAWTPTNAVTWGISSNQIYLAGSNGPLDDIACMIDGGNANATGQVTIATAISGNGGNGIALRGSTTLNDYFFSYSYNGAGGGNSLDLYNPSGASLSHNSTNFTSGDVMKVSVDGSNAFTVYKNGVSVMTTSSSANATKTNFGVLSDNNVARLDDWSLTTP